MTAHMTVPAIESESIPATVSASVLTGLLREELNFRGLLVTDAMDMQGLASQFAPGEAAVRALAAGVDVLLMPPKPEEAVDAILAAVKQGRLSVNRIDRSVARILAAKVRVGLHRRRLVDPSAYKRVLTAPDAETHAGAVAERALTLVKNEGGAFPPKDPGRTCFVILAERPGSTQGRRLEEEVVKRAPGARIVTLNASQTDAQMAQAAAEARSADAIVIAAFASVAAFRGDVALPGAFPDLVSKLAASGKPVTIVAFGSPYLLRGFAQVPAHLAAFSTTTTSEAALARAVFGEIPVRGRLPVTIPGLAAAGQGIDIAPTTAKSP